MHTHRTTQKNTIAIVGGESLLGKEVRDLLETSDLAANVKLIAADTESTIIAAGREEPVVINSLQMADVGTARVVILAGPSESSAKAFEQIQGSKPAPLVIDMSGSLEDNPAARLRVPMLEDGLKIRPALITVIPHPAAIALALFLTQLRKAGAIRRSVVEIFEPASERGKEGIDELQKQTVGLLSFKPLPKEVYDAQVSFNLLPKYGSDSPHSLEEIELKIDRHLASILASSANVPMPSLRLIQAPVFHGYSLSVWVEFEENPGRDAIVEAITLPRIDVRAKDEEPPTNVGVAGQGGIAAGAITADRNDPRAFWFWVVTDNLRISAENAMEVARELLQ
jgi:aspartate-semialdehyde dehydrogenase